MTYVHSSIWSIDRTLSGSPISGQSRPGSDGNKGVLHIPPNFTITEASPSDCLRHPLEEPYSVAKMQSVYSGPPANRATFIGGILPLYRDAVGVFWSLPPSTTHIYSFFHLFIPLIFFLLINNFTFSLIYSFFLSFPSPPNT